MSPRSLSDRVAEEIDGLAGRSVVGVDDLDGALRLILEMAARIETLEKTQREMAAQVAQSAFWTTRF